MRKMPDEINEMEKEASKFKLAPRRETYNQVYALNSCLLSLSVNWAMILGEKSGAGASVLKAAKSKNVGQHPINKTTFLGKCRSGQ